MCTKVRPQSLLQKWGVDKKSVASDSPFSRGRLPLYTAYRFQCTIVEIDDSLFCASGPDQYASQSHRLIQYKVDARVFILNQIIK